MHIYLLISLIGIITGFIGGYAGVGGAPLIIVLLTLFCGYSQHMAQGTVLAMMMGPMSLLAVIASWKYVKPNIKIISISSISYAIFSYWGGKFAYFVDSKELQFYFAILLIVFGFLYSTLILERKVEGKPILRLNYIYLIIMGILLGFTGGFFGIGSGILLVPIFTILFGMDQNSARAISLAILLPPVSAGGVIQYGYYNSDINWLSAAILLISYMIMNGMGSKLGNSQSPEKLKRVLGIILILSGISLIFLKKCI